MTGLKSSAVVLVLLLFSPASQALHWDKVYRLCPEQAGQLTPLLEEAPIPVGCELAGCCPGCPGPGFIDWRIHIDDSIMRGARLRFNGMDERHLLRLQFSGDAKLTMHNEILLGTGDIEISGLPEMVDSRVPMGFITPLVLEKTQLKKNIAKGAAPARNITGDENDANNTDGIRIDQYRGRFLVNTYRSRFVMNACSEAADHTLSKADSHFNDGVSASADTGSRDE